MNKLIYRFKNIMLLYKYVIAICFFILLFFQVSLSKIAFLPNFIDEIILVVIFFYSLIKSVNDLIIRRLMLIYITSFVFYFILSLNAVPYRGLSSVILQIFIHLKFILFVSFIWITLGVKYSVKVSYLFLSITVIFLFVNLLSDNYFNEIFDIALQKRGGGVRPVGIQADTASLGISLALFGCLLITGIKDLLIKYKAVLFLLFTILILLTTVRTALLFIPLIILWWLKDSLKSFAIALVLIVTIIIPLKSSNYMDELIDITAQNIEWTVDNPVESGYIRGIMIYFSVELANDRFPLGTGAATFGTVMSDDSHIYSEIGLLNSRFFVDKEGIYDSNFASILGEFGYFGLFIYFYIFYLVIKAPCITGKFNNEAQFRFVYFLLVLGYSIATPIFMNTYPALIISLVLVSSYRNINLKKDF